MSNKWIDFVGRKKLKDILPLETPLALQIEPTRLCNYKCFYCSHSNSDSKIIKLSKNTMSIKDFKKIINDLKIFKEKIKAITFCGLGEPLLNKDISIMVSMAKEISDSVRIITNGHLLTNKLSDDLINSGLDYLRISLQGLNADDYYKTCGVKINFDKFLSNIRYFYEKRGKCALALKITNFSVDTEEKVKYFNDIFNSVSDNLEIQNIKIFDKEISDYKVDIEKETSVYSTKITTETVVCPQPFFQMLILVNGQILPCCNVYDDKNLYFIGDVNEQSLKEIWNCNKLKYLRILHLKGERYSVEYCKNCEYIINYKNEHDDIDNVREELINLYKHAQYSNLELPPPKT